MDKEVKIEVRNGYIRQYFDEQKRAQYDARNTDFWQRLENLQKIHPEANIAVELFLTGYHGVLYESVSILCDEDKTKCLAEQILHQYYYLVPLQFYPQFEGRDDVLKELMPG
jgi:hypothetical protein